jgi:hypothetical protein
MKDQGSGKGHAVYRPKEFALEYRQITGLPERCFYAIADTLTMVFDEAKRVLVGLDAYTNCANWKLSKILLPNVQGEGRLVICEAPQDDRVDLGVTPVYEFSRRDKRLRILLGDVSCNTHYIVSPGLVVGMHGNGTVGELIVLDVKEEN